MRFNKTCAIVAGGAFAAAASAQTFDVVGGKTSVDLDFALLDAAAGLDFAQVVGPVIAPGDLGDDSVAFPINARDGSLPTTFSYEAGLASFSGAIEHAGGVEFNTGAVTVGDFTIGFDGDRASGAVSGFFVESTLSINAILFDVANPNVIQADAGGLIIEGDLWVSPEFAGFLGDTALTGANVGEARIDALVPAPGAMAALGLGGLLAARRRR